MTGTREATVKNDRQEAREMTARVLDGAVKRLRRLGKRRGSPKVKAAYRNAADVIKRQIK